MRTHECEHAWGRTRSVGQCGAKNTHMTHADAPLGNATVNFVNAINSCEDIQNTLAAMTYECLFHIAHELDNDSMVSKAPRRVGGT